MKFFHRQGGGHIALPAYAILRAVRKCSVGADTRARLADAMDEGENELLDPAVRGLFSVVRFEDLAAVAEKLLGDDGLETGYVVAGQDGWWDRERWRTDRAGRGRRGDGRRGIHRGGGRHLVRRGWIRRG